MKDWTKEAVFYHIYPLGFCGCEQYAQDIITNRISKIEDWIPHIKKLHVNAVYLGPVFESYEHGYDTSDYQLIDHRLGSNADFRKVCDAFHEAGIRIVLDGVFNHVGRNFWAFQDVQKHKQASNYCGWFHNLNFSANSPAGDDFTYDTWEGHFNLIKLNLANEEVVQYLFSSIALWMDDFGIDGLRLDAADCIDKTFFQRLKTFCKSKKADFWLMGEIIHGDYTMWANPSMLDSVTNYECYKGLYSSHNEKNYFEIAHSLNRQFGKGGIYEQLVLYNFVDNHDVNRLASVMKDENDIPNIYTIMFTMPGIPSIYYGSEFAIKGEKHNGSDAALRPFLDLAVCQKTNPSLPIHIAKLSAIHQKYPALTHGTYDAISIANQQFVFQRCYEDQTVIIACNVSDDAHTITIPCKFPCAYEALSETTYDVNNAQLQLKMEAKSSYIFVPTIEHTTEEVKQENPVEILETTKDEIKEECVSIEKDTITKIPSISPQDSLPLGRYEHYKGKHYTVLYVGTHSETLEKYVVYRQLYGDESVWVRPLSMFLESVNVAGVNIPRFRFLND